MNHCHICGLLLTEMSLCGAYLYFMLRDIDVCAAAHIHGAFKF